MLEIGPGTGQATGPLLDTGATVVAFELGAELAELLELKYRNRRLEVVVGPFEDVELAEGPFDVVAGGTSFHWVPPDRGLLRCGAVLRSGGSLALWWNYFGDPARPDPFPEALQTLLHRHAPQLADNAHDGSAGAGAHPYALDVETRIAEIDAVGLFGNVRHEVIAWTGVHTVSEMRRMFASFSPWMALDSEARDALLDDIERLATNEFDGSVERPYLTLIYTTKRL